MNDQRDEYGFWGDEPERPTRRQPITRRHRTVDAAVPAPADPPSGAVRQIAPFDPFADEFDPFLDGVDPAPVADDIEVFGPDDRRGLLADVDPVVKRIGVMVLVAALLAPIALALRPDDDPPGQLRSVPDTVATVPAGAAPTTAATPPPAVAVPAAQGVTGEGVGGAAPAAAAAPAVVRPRVCTTGYKVRPGDFWIRIARIHGITLKQLLQANNARATTPIYPGRIVCLPNGVQPVTAAPATTAPAAKAPATTKAPAATKAPTTTKAPVRTAPAVAAAPATTAAPQRSYTRDQVIAIIREIWPDDLEERAILIATRESNLQPGVRNSCCFGLFQLYFNVHKSWLSQIGVTTATQLYDPKVNAFAALVLYNRAGGWGPWKQTAG
jgi:LysM repeat protein